jgi:hypothetical protein
MIEAFDGGRLPMGRARGSHHRPVRFRHAVGGSAPRAGSRRLVGGTSRATQPCAG